MRFTLKQIQHAEVLAQHRNFREAAQALYLTQPALTRSIKSLESHLGGRLFDRVATGVQPTKAGYIFLDRARQLLTKTQDMERELSALLGMETGSFTLATGPCMGDYLVPEAMARLIREHRKLNYRLHERDWADIPTTVLEQEVELAVADITSACDDPRFETELLISSPLYYTCRRDHPLANRRNVPLEDVGLYPLAATSLPPHMAGYLSSPALSQSTIQEDGRPAPKITVNCYATTKRVLLGSDAVSLVSPCQVESELVSGTLTFIDTEPVPLRINLGFISLARRTLSQPAIHFMEEARSMKLPIEERAAKITEEFQLR